MKNLIKKSLLLGIGAISLTRDKAEQFVKELEEKGEVKSHEAKDFVDELIEKGEQEKILFKEAVKREVLSLQQGMGLVRKNDLAGFEERLKKIEDKLGLTVDQNTANQNCGENADATAMPDFPSGE